MFQILEKRKYKCEKRARRIPETVFESLNHVTNRFFLIKVGGDRQVESSRKKTQKNAQKTPKVQASA
jgi:hypothetical protein